MTMFDMPAWVNCFCVSSRATIMRCCEALLLSSDTSSFNKPSIPVIQNVNVVASDDVEQIRILLKEQLYNPVRWVETVQAMADRGADVLIEAGPGKVLSGLCKRIDKQLSALPVFDGASLEKALEAVNG